MKNLKLLILLVLCTFLFTGTYAQIQDLNQPIPADPNIKIGKLDNGMTYYIKVNKKPEKRIELRLAVTAGISSFL
jgi:zinc protease